MWRVAHACIVCLTGNLGFYRCSDRKTVVVKCDECDTLWRTPRRIDEAGMLETNPPEFRVPGLEVAISGDGTGWATRDEVVAQGWGDDIAGEGVAMDEALEDAQRAKTEPPVECPRCHQHWLEDILLVKLQLVAVHCPACDALWLGRAPAITDHPAPGEFVDYTTFMKEHGRLDPHAQGEKLSVHRYTRPAKRE